MKKSLSPEAISFQSLSEWESVGDWNGFTQGLKWFQSPTDCIPSQKAFWVGWEGEMKSQEILLFCGKKKRLIIVISLS